MEGVILNNHFVKKGGWFALYFFAIRNFYLNFRLFRIVNESTINLIPINIRINIITKSELIMLNAIIKPNPSNRTPKKNSEIPNL